MELPELVVESLDQEARGVGHHEGKVIFVEDGLPGERLRFESYRRKKSYENARAAEHLSESSIRVAPRCRYFGICGGCSMQHVDSGVQVSIKQRVLEDSLRHLGKIRPAVVFRAIQGPFWGYRFRARLSVRHVAKKGGVLVGFHERRSSYVADMQSCEVLPARVSALLMPLRQLIAGLSIRDRLPQIEVAQGEETLAMVLRILEPFSPKDEKAIAAFAAEHGVQFWLQEKGPDTARPFDPADRTLAYRLPEFGLVMPFKPTDFTQVNHAINRVMIARAIRLLDPQPTERIADFFCGLGNFTLPIATRAGFVVGLEGSAALAQRARENAVVNGLGDKVTFATANLFDAKVLDLDALGPFDKWLIDPPREGALELVKALVAHQSKAGFSPPKRIVYVSCNPATLARDAAVLVHEGGWILQGAGVINMFPQTSHVESIALLERPMDAAAQA